MMRVIFPIMACIKSNPRALAPEGKNLRSSFSNF